MGHQFLYCMIVYIIIAECKAGSVVCFVLDTCLELKRLCDGGKDCTEPTNDKSELLCGKQQLSLPNLFLWNKILCLN